MQSFVRKISQMFLCCFIINICNATYYNKSVINVIIANLPLSSLYFSKVQLKNN